MIVEWNNEKNELLKKTRKVSFDVVPLVEMKNGGWFLKTIYQSRKYKKEGGK